MKSLFRLKPYLRPYLGLIAISGLLAIPLGGLRAAPAAMINYLLGTVIPSHNEARLLEAVGVVILIYIANFVVRFFHYYSLRIVIAQVNQKIKNELYEHVLGLSADYFTARSTGNLISRVGVDPQQIDSGIACINTLVREPVTFLMLAGYALHLNWRLTCVTFLIFPPLAWVFHVTGRNLKRYILRMSEENARLFSSLQESFTGIRIVKTFRLEKYVRKKFRERSETYTKFYLKTALLEEASHPLVELLTAFLIAAIVYFGGTQVFQGRMTQADLLAFFAAFALMMNPLRTLNDVNIKLHQAAAACERIFEIFDYQPHYIEGPSPIPIKSFEREIRFSDVRFTYPDAPEREVLKGVSFTLPKGRVIALAGASGAGKSSVISLLSRIFDVSQGRIEIDGCDIRELSLEDLRRIIAVVTQDVFLFNDTIEENIRCGKLSATQEEIREAARRAHVTEFVEKLPEGYQTVIGDRGQKLSGGERQRLSIARAFLREAPILILDEATSSLDLASERAVQSALDDLIKNRTTLMIAHRLSTIQHADQILVLKEGTITETGRHDELLKLGGEYARFFEVGAL